MECSLSGLRFPLVPLFILDAVFIVFIFVIEYNYVRPFLFCILYAAPYRLCLVAFAGTADMLLSASATHLLTHS